ncbi:MAG TPA: hypothetical protein DCL15_08035, partial [Chloroflexi bacterium]|nr:hypothetical protein [Chloroflexota bacterium]
MLFPRTSPPTVRIEIRRQQDHHYVVTLRRLDGGQSDDHVEIADDEVRNWLAQSQRTPDAVGAALTARLFTPKLLGFYRQQLGGAPGGVMRIELCLPEPDNPLHALPWELLHRPVGATAPLPLAADETTPFARFDAL